MPRQGDRSSFPKDAFLTVPICGIAHQLLRCGKAKHICPFEGLSDTLNELSTASNGDMSLQIKLSTLNKDVKLAVIGPGTTKVRTELSRATKLDIKIWLVSLEHFGHKNVLSGSTMVIYF